MKRKFTRLSTSQKNRLRLKYKVRILTVAGILSLGAFTASFLLNNFIINEESKANNRVNGIQTLAAFKFRKQISLNRTLLPESSPLYDFPMMISLQDPDLKSVANGGKVISEKGFDIRFTKADGISLLDFEIEKYNPKNGEILVWVRMDTIGVKHSKPLFIYFCNRFAVDESSDQVWNKTYKGVWHLKGLLSSKAPFSNQFAQAVFKSDQQDIINPTENNSSQFPLLNSSQDINITGNITLSAWINFQTAKEQVILTNQLNRKGGYRLALNRQNKLEFTVWDKSGQMASAHIEEKSIKLEKNKWIHVAAVYSDSLNLMATYVNGNIYSQSNTTLSMSESPDILQIGVNPINRNECFSGSIDEVHIASSALNQEWIKTEFNNQSDPSSFFTIGKTEGVEQQISMSFLSLEAESKGDHIELRWITAEESNSQIFSVERSSDGLSFEEIGTKVAAGNSNEVLNYRFRDESPRPGNNFYRIVLQDLEDRREYSMITPVKYNKTNEDEIQVSSTNANAFIKDFSVDYQVPKTGKVKVRLTNIKGEVISEQEVYCERHHSQRFHFRDEKNNTAGIFFLNITQNDISKTIKLLKRL